MEVRIDKRYPLPVSAQAAWCVLRDIHAVAGCMPGAQITEQISDHSYKGVMKVKVGPAQAQFGGTLEVLETDPEGRRMALRGKGADKGGSSASLDLHAVIEADASDPARSTLHGDARLEVNGKFAQFGARMMGQVSELLLTQFVQNFGTAAQAAQAPAAPAQAAAPEQAQPAGPSQQAAMAGPRQRHAASELNGLALAWALFKGWLASLFGRRR